jgi:hypothetical protein
MELKSMIDFVFYIGNLDIARKSSHKEMVTLIFNMLCCLKTNYPYGCLFPVKRR